MWILSQRIIHQKRSSGQATIQQYGKLVQDGTSIPYIGNTSPENYGIFGLMDIFWNVDKDLLFPCTRREKELLDIYFGCSVEPVTEISG
jgi:hypothetical protein